MITTTYDTEADVLHVSFGHESGMCQSSAEVAPGVFVEFDSLGEPIGIEVICVRRRTEGALH